MTAAIRARAETAGDDVALVDDSGRRTWSEVADDLQRAAGALLAVAPGADQRVSVLGENAIATLEAHAAALTVGVGTVATSRQLRADELADQYADAGVTCAITGRSSRPVVHEVAARGGVGTVVVHGSGTSDTDDAATARSRGRSGWPRPRRCRPTRASARPGRCWSTRRAPPAARAGPRSGGPPRRPATADRVRRGDHRGVGVPARRRTSSSGPCSTTRR